MVRRPIFALPLLTCAALGCRVATIPPSVSPVSQHELSVTGVALVDVPEGWPVRRDQVQPQLHLRALEQALEDARGQLLSAVAEVPVNGTKVTLGDMMAQSADVRLLTEDFVWGLANEAPAWDLEAQRVEVPLTVEMGQVQSFINTLPYAYLAATVPSSLPLSEDVAEDLPPPQSDPNVPEARPSAAPVGTLSLPLDTPSSGQL